MSVITKKGKARSLQNSGQKNAADKDPCVRTEFEVMQRLKIFIDPLLQSKYGPEICWTWRLLLTGIGYSWEEVSSHDSESDIAYVTSLEQSPKSRLCVRANLDHWDRLSSLRLKTVGHYDSLSYPLFEDEHSSSPSICFKSNDRLVCERDIIFDIFWLITGQEERHWPKDKHGFFNLNGAPFFQEQVFRLALASSIGFLLEKEFLCLGFSEPVPRWPHKKRAAACLSHDVDYPEIIRWLEPIRVIGRQGLSGFRTATSVLAGARTHWHFPSWVQMEKDIGARSAFYFVARQGSLLQFAFGTPDPFYNVRSERFRQLFNYLTDEGFEIGLHASYLAFESRKKFAAEREILQQASGQEICGNRHHYWHLNPEDVESTLMLHEQIGLKYDTSLTHERYVGWRRGLSWPFFPFHQAERRQLKTLQIPTAWMDDHLFGHLKHNPGDRFETLQTLIDKAAEHGGCLVIDVHDYVFDDTLFPNWRKTYYWLIKNLIDRSDFWIATPGEIADHWTSRYSSILDLSYGLREGL